MTLLRPVDAAADVESLDPVARQLKIRVDLISPRLQDLLHGRWLGHPVHPAVAQVPLGAWLSATVLDLVAAADPDRGHRAGTEQAASTLVGVGLAAAPLAGLSGATDWAQLHEDQQRVGLLHAAVNGAAMLLLGGSLLLRRAGRHGSGRVLGLAGTTVATVGATVGGQLGYRWAAGANHAEHVPHTTPEGWHEICRIEQLPDGGLSRRTVADTPVVALRRGDQVRILADHCSHLSGPLSSGELTRHSGQDCVRCPWHGSTFRFADGHPVAGPATAPQPTFEVRVTGGVVTARVRTAKGVPAS